MHNKTIAVFLIFLNIESYGQILISRSFDLDPMKETIEKKRRLLGAAWFGTEAAHGFFSAGEALTWDIKYQGFIEFFRWGNKAAIGLSLAHELYANPFNEIYFNPRSAFWNESLTYYRKLKKLTLQVGMHHRCRHDIDNADPPKPGIPRATYQPEGRVLVLTSFSAGGLSEQIDINPKLSSRFFGHTDAYLYTEDSRLPVNNQEGSWENIRASLLGGFLLHFSFADNWQMYSRNHMNYILFKVAENKINYRTEAGITLYGSKVMASFFLSFEYFFDDTSRSFPQPSSVLFLGIRGSSHNFF